MNRPLDNQPRAAHKSKGESGRLFDSSAKTTLITTAC
jgi:hypothetical protein